MKKKLKKYKNFAKNFFFHKNVIQNEIITFRALLGRSKKLSIGVLNLEKNLVKSPSVNFVVKDYDIKGTYIERERS